MSLMGEGGVPAVMNVEPAGSSGNNNGVWGGDWGAWIILFLIFGMFGWGGMGMGGFGGFGGMMGGYPVESILQRSLDTQTIIGKLDGLNSGVCSLGYDQLAQMNNLSSQVATGFANMANAICNSEYQNAQLINGVNANMMQGFNAANIVALQGQNALATQLADCCCKNQSGQQQIINAIDSNACQTGRAIERGFCDTNYNQATNTTAIIQNAHNDTDRVLAKLDAMEMSRKDETIAALRQQLQTADFAASQAAQNTYLVNQLRPCPTPAYITCNPWASQAAYGSCGTC